MLKYFFNFVIKHQFVVLFLCFLAVGAISVFIPKLQIDASAQTLLLEDDKDLKISREVDKRYETPEFLILAYSPKDGILSPKSLKIIKEISEKLEKLDFVSSVTSIMNVPLLQSTSGELKNLTKHIPTLMDVDLSLAKTEFLTSPLYKGNLVSKDFKTTGILINLKSDKKYANYLETQEKMHNQKNTKAFKDFEEEFKNYRHKMRDTTHDNIDKIRQILQPYKLEEKIFLGGVNMIADDMISFVKNDILIYGSSLCFLLCLSLWVFFRQIRWVVLPIFICVVSVAANAGLLGIFGWEVTVISSNFISLQLIITISIILHLIVRYRELVVKFPNAKQEQLVSLCVLSKANPSFFAIVTTIAGFSSLVFSNILPVINLGLMMSLGIFLSLILSFILFAAIVSLLPKVKPVMYFEEHFSLTKICKDFVLNHGKFIIVFFLVLFIFGVAGSFNIMVENSFINYFKKSTEIYKGMEIIDTKLGGTTPLDVIVTFKDKEKKSSNVLDDFEAEFSEAEKEDKYWFSREKMEIIKKVHYLLESQPYVGKVLSLATLLELGKNINDNKDLDSFALSILYSELPEKYKEQMLSPYINIEKNEARFSLRVIDSSPSLRREQFLKKLEQDLTHSLKNDDVKFQISGMMVLYNNMLQSLYSSQIDTFGSVILIIGVIFWLIFNSLKMSIIALVANIIPILAVFGLMGFFGVPLDMMSITIAAISVGIGVDDTIHYIHRFREELNLHKNYRKAIETSHQSIGYAMYYTSFAIILGFSVLVVSNFIPTIYFGLLTVLVMSLVLMSALLLLPRLIIVFKPYKIS